MKNVKTYNEHVNEHINEGVGFKPQSSGSKELDSFIKRKFSWAGIYPAYSDGEIFVGYLRKEDDHTWNSPCTYYYNSAMGSPESEASIKYRTI